MDVDTILAVIGFVGLAASEIIGLNPRWKSNTIIQVLIAVAKSCKKK
jgi:hypothetical protein